jgi:hypothetical protein
VILEHSVLGLHTCLVPVLLSSPLLSCIPCLGSALQYTPLHLLSAFIPCVHHDHLDPSIAPLYLLRYSTADPLNSLSTFRANPHRPRWTIRPTDRNSLFKIIQVMSAVNYRLELPTQWSIHPVFHIDLLTPYQETIMHGPNFTRPTPELIDGEEEYSVERILDSRRHGRRWRLQYLVKWEGYPDVDNMWIDKDDVFADDKVWEFKLSNPDAETHIRSTLTAKSPYPSALTRSQLLYQHALSHMSSDGNSDFAHEYPAGAIRDSPIPLSQELPLHSPIPVVDFATLQPLDPSTSPFVPRPVTATSSASDIAAMFRQLRVHTPAPLTPDGQRAAQQANEMFAVSFTPAKR